MEKDLQAVSQRFLEERVAPEMPDYEVRTSQLEMMGACARTAVSGGTLMVEAGTGTGKTFAYLIPAILSGKKTVISTRTINLQEQIMSKDLAFLSHLRGFDYAIAKGRSNYLCLRRLYAFRPADAEEAAEYSLVHGWVSEASTGDREEASAGRSPLWERLHSDADACRGKKCNYFKQCFYFSARQKWEKAQLVVANHSILGINAMLPEDSRILPEAEVLVIDEAHALDRALSDQIGITMSRRGFENIMNSLLKVTDRGTYKGLLSGSPLLFGPVETLRSEMGLFWVKVSRELPHRTALRGTFGLSEQMISLSASIRSLTDSIRSSATGLFEEDDEVELKAAVMKLAGFADSLEIFPAGLEGFVRWAETEENRTTLRMSPVYPRDFVKDNIMPIYSSVILTSATLSIAGDFGFTSGLLGFEGSEKISVPSPFDLREQVSVEVKRGIDLRENQGAAALAQVIVAETSRRDGGVLVLFTSREVMKRTWGLAREALSDLGLTAMVQGEMPNRAMLDIMRKTEDSVIFGLDSFWEGVDIKGDSLKCLIITKLPFEVPTEPVVTARTEEIDRKGGRPFYEYSLPRAVLKFKQGFGRLIRSGADRGRIIICDERVETKSYGRMFLRELY